MKWIYSLLFTFKAHQNSGCWFEHKLPNISQHWLHFNFYSCQCWMHHLIAALWILVVCLSCSSHTHKDIAILFKLIVCSCLSSLVHLCCAWQVSQISLDCSPRLNHEMQLFRDSTDRTHRVAEFHTDSVFFPQVMKKWNWRQSCRR